MDTIAYVLYLLAVLFGTPSSAFAASPTHPVVIVPTVLGTLPSEDGSVVDPIFHTYDNLVDTFVANGYVEGESLFVFPYDWEASNITTASQLKQQIADAIATCSCGTAADVIAHGQGGLVAWQYLTSAEYNDDINQLVFLGTPFGGVPAAYLGWEGGVFRMHSNFTGRALGQALLSAEARDAGSGSNFAYVQDEVPSFSQMLPVFTDYLFSVGTSYPTGYPTNPFLENLFGIGFGSVSMLNVAADTNQSDSSIEGFFTAASTEPPAWPHGEPTSIDLVFGGDRVVPRAAIESFVTVDQFFDSADHTSLPTEAQSFLFEALTGEAPLTLVQNDYDVECMLFLSPTAGSDLQITDPEGDRLGKDFSTGDVFDEIPNSFYSGYDADTEYAVIVNPQDGTYAVEVEGSSAFTIDAATACGEELTEATVGGDEDTTDFNLEVDADGETLTLEPALDPVPGDTTAPVIAISSPAQGASYLSNDIVPFTASITDDSPIAETTYLFNNAPVDSSDPLPLGSAPLGAASAAVAASDTAGNRATSTVNFTITPPPADTTPPTIVITNPEKYGLYAKTETVFLTANITDASPLAKTTHWHNNKKINPANKLPLTLGINKVAVAAQDVHGNAATSSLAFFVVKNKSSCLIDIIAILIAITQDHTLPDKPTLQNLILDCKALLKGKHHH